MTVTHGRTNWGAPVTHGAVPGSSLAVVATRRGPPEVLELVRRPVPRPGTREVLLRVRACTVARPDVQARYGLTPFAPRAPFVPGYAVVGDVLRVGGRVGNVMPGDRVGALAMTGGYAEHLVLPARRLTPVPRTVDPAEAAPVLLNHLVAHQVMHRSARVREGDRVLVIGASGGIGTAFLQLGRLAGLSVYGTAAADRQDVVRAYGAVPVDHHTEDVAEVLRRAEPEGLDAVFDGVGGDYVRRCLPLLRSGGRYVVYGNPLGLGGLARLLVALAVTNLRPDGRSLRVYGTTSSLRHPRPFHEDWARLFDLLSRRRIEPVVARRFDLASAAEANALLESGSVTGNLVLVMPGPDPGGEDDASGAA